MSTSIERILRALHTVPHRQLGKSRAAPHGSAALTDLLVESSMKIQTDLKAGGGGLLDLDVDIKIDVDLTLFGCGGKKGGRKGC